MSLRIVATALPPSSSTSGRPAARAQASWRATSSAAFALVAPGMAAAIRAESSPIVPRAPRSAAPSGPSSAARMLAASSPVTATVSAAEPCPTAPPASSTSATTYSTASVRRAAVTKGWRSGARWRWRRTAATSSTACSASCSMGPPVTGPT